jgi:hypothetical protein
MTFTIIESVIVRSLLSLETFEASWHRDYAKLHRAIHGHVKQITVTESANEF